MSEQLPGVDRIDMHEGRLTGAFDLTRADMAQVRYEGRVMVCLVADIVSPLGIVTTKDGDIKAKWTLKPVDVALVRDPGMQAHLGRALSIITPDMDEDPDLLEHPGEDDDSQLVGVYDEEGAFLGFQKIEPEDVEVEEVLEVPIPPAPPRERPKVVPLDDGDDGLPPVQEREVFGQPIQHDKALQDFLGV